VQKEKKTEGSGGGTVAPVVAFAREEDEKREIQRTGGNRQRPKHKETHQGERRKLTRRKRKTAIVFIEKSRVTT